MLLRTILSRRRAPAIATALTLMLFAVPVQAVAAAQMPTDALPAAGADLALPTHGDPVQRFCDAASTPGEMACLAVKRTDVAQHRSMAPDDVPNGYGPTDLHSAYHLPAGRQGSGRTVAVVDAYDNPKAESDLAVYRAQYGLPACTTDNGCFRKVNQEGAASPLPPVDSGWAAEISLDLDMVSAVCPDCRILLVEADAPYMDGLGTAVDTAVRMGAEYVSNSYGGSEPSAADLPVTEAYFDHPGVAITASSGDSGYGVSYPASSALVTAVGGTSLSRDSSARGWTESAWTGAGSGCSAVSVKPDFQHDPGCGRRSVTDVSAVADPATGVAVYNSFQEGGWAVYGGTSAASPIVAAVYALAGQPATGSRPNTYPALSGRGLNDVVAGSNGTCPTAAAYLCAAGAGYDGPTGLGTPDGTAAFTDPGPHGTLTGTVNGAGHKPVAGATISVAGASTTTDAHGGFNLTLPAGNYTVDVTAYGYTDVALRGVSLRDGATVDRTVTLKQAPMTTIHGTVTDSSGHGWPLSATVQVAGRPGAPVRTDPATGKYQLTVPQKAAYELTFSAVYPGYRPEQRAVTVGASGTRADMALHVDAASCTAPGYATQTDTLVDESFNDNSLPTGWTGADANPNGGWRFDNPGARGNNTGGSGPFAIVDSDYYGAPKRQDTVLQTSAVNLAGDSAPVLTFGSDFSWYGSDTADVDLSLDGGSAWQTVWHQKADHRFRSERIPLPTAAGHSDVLVRFHYTGAWSGFWAVDDVRLKATRCTATPGGLLVGRVTDRNTGAGVGFATVGAGSATSAPTSTDLNDTPASGAYWLFSPQTGKLPVTAVRGGYGTSRSTARVAADQVSHADIALGAGHITVEPGSISRTLPQGHTRSVDLTLRNDGQQPATVRLTEDLGSSGAASAAGTPLRTVTGHFRPGPTAVAHDQATAPPAAGASPAPSDSPASAWSAAAAYPTRVMDNLAAAHNGRVYSVGGTDGTDILATGQVYDPVADAWSPISPMQHRRMGGYGAFIGDRLYVAGGLDQLDGQPLPALEIYDPKTDHWSSGALAPDGFSAAATAVLDGRMYTVGGCTSDLCGQTSVSFYDPATDSWSRVADYPEPTSYAACGGLAGKVYCTGGTTDAGASSHKTYAYNPASDTWSPAPDLPLDLWGAGYSVADGRLLVSGGVTGHNSTLTNQGYAFDPTAQTWTALPTAPETSYRGGSACGFYRIGGATGGSTLSAQTSVLPGFDSCGTTDDIEWLSEDATRVAIAPGRTVHVKVTLDSGRTAGPGRHTARLNVATDTPYDVPPVEVTLHVPGRH
ncbi:carboxypeptidase regulatory-like domain-containing protein [Streptomyces sp. NBC_00344]|uniref:carboxypeptidase regulatory-like domain-containing protein n=1 Tax=Streptomyces sp. NBC_00344 TaxID=2975720 RepID=UPI002E20F6F7